MTWGLGTSSWASSTSLEFVRAPPVEIGGGGGGGPGGGGEGRHGALRVKQVRSEVGLSGQQEENVLFHLLGLAWCSLITQEITLTQADALKLTCVALGGRLPAPVLSPDSQTSPSASSVSPA